jgi:hypothetical protein
MTKLTRNYVTAPYISGETEATSSQHNLLVFSYRKPKDMSVASWEANKPHPVCISVRKIETSCSNPMLQEFLDGALFNAQSNIFRSYLEAMSPDKRMNVVFTEDDFNSVAVSTAAKASGSRNFLTKESLTADFDTYLADIILGKLLEAGDSEDVAATKAANYRTHYISFAGPTYRPKEAVLKALDTMFSYCAGVLEDREIDTLQLPRVLAKITKQSAEATDTDLL